MLPAENLLSRETSPYLLQHAANPVHWRPWGHAALEEARALDKPILLSIGYAACHWCHVMAHESFENEKIAGLMNDLFVNIKIDREERPDIDHIYMSALHAMGQQGGWPLTMFIAPDGAPFWGGTYFPPEPRWGRASFPQVLAAVHEAWRERRDSVAKNGRALTEHLAELSATTPGAALGPRQFQQFSSALLAQVDRTHGGIGDAPKFPNAPIFRFFWQEHCRGGRADLDDAVRHMLTSMCEGGIYDHLGGGFARYSVDAEWHVPHFEKMLYDNAQILDLLALTHAAQPSRLYAERAKETVAWLMREMRGDADAAGDRAFAAAQDADQEGEEGLFYTWTSDEVRAALGGEAQAFADAYDVRAGGNWEGRNVLRRVSPYGDAGAEIALAASRAKLFDIRESREKPARDDKILVDWNGLMIRALARAAIVFDRPSWLEAAESAFRFIDRVGREENGRLAHAWRGRVSAVGQLDDYAAFTLAALALFETTGARACLDTALSTAREARQLFGDDDGSLFITAAGAADVPVGRPRHVRDNATPSGVGLMAEAFARLWHLTGDARWREACERLIRAFSGAGAALALSPTLLAAADLLERAAVVVVAGEDGADALLRAALAAPDPAICVLRTKDGADWLPTSPAHGRTPVGGKAAAYVCRAMVCGLPATDVNALRAELSSAGTA
ncbi:MAG: thioredoxin domain-containing protein [Rhodoblastus sp.]|nr:thioredoxin domain-containing protein [Rhodoblastus sp.]